MFSFELEKFRKSEFRIIIRMTKFENVYITRISEYRKVWIPECRNFAIPEFRNVIIPEYRN